MTVHPLLMKCSLDELRAKLRDPASPLAPWWQHLLTLAWQDPVWYSPYTVLVAIVTGEDSYRELARRNFMRFVELSAEGYTSNDAQFHTHVTSAPVGRWAVFYDWIADLGILSAEEDSAFRRTLLDYAYLFPLQHLQSRMKSFENQVFSNAFSVSTIGYVLGVKRGDNAVARELYSRGLMWLQELIGRLPEGGYSPEGSTYHEQVVIPLTVLSASFIEEVTGLPVFEKGLPPFHRPVNLLLQTSCRMIGPGGLLPAWDAYGFQPASVKSGLVCLARRFRDPNPLAIIRDLDMWYRVAHPAWEIDDRLWTLVWWPTDLTVPASPEFPSWLVPEIGGALQSNRGKTRLFQCWDECGGVPSSGRNQVDPNAMTLEAFGSPLLLDGAGNPDRTVLPLPVDDITTWIGARTIESVQEYCFSSWGVKLPLEQAVANAMNGSVGMSNALVFDHEGWYVPLSPKHGKGEVLHIAGPLQVIRGNATDYYSDRYDVGRVTRSSVMVGGRYVLTSDRVVSQSPHTLTWQAFLREQATVQGAKVVVCTPEQVQCDVIPLQAGSLVLTPVAGYPTRMAEGCSARVQHTVAPACDVRIDMALVPQTCLGSPVDLTDGWSRDIEGRVDQVSLTDAYLSDPGTHPRTPRRFERTVVLDPSSGKRTFLSVQMGAKGLHLTVNGKRFEANTPCQGVWPDSTVFLPRFFDITSAVKAGVNLLVLEAPYFHGESVCGPVELSREQATNPVRVDRAGKDAFQVCIGNEVDDVLVDRETGTGPWAGGETDARYAVLTSDVTVAVAQAMNLSLPFGLRFKSQAPCDLVWQAGLVELSNLTGNCQAEVAWKEGTLAVESSGILSVTYSGASPILLKLQLPEPRMVSLNGRILGLRGGADEKTVTLKLSPEKVVASSVPASVEEVYVLAETRGVSAAPLFITALRSPDWRVQLAATEMTGRFGLRDAVPVLLEFLAESQKEIPYPPLKKWWSWSKMLRNSDSEEGAEPDLAMPIAVKRWRVRRAVISALGRIGDPRAVAPIEQALIRCDDFFPVTSQLAVALGRLGSQTSIPVLERFFHHAEVNTQVHARLSLALIRGTIDRAVFEAQAV